MISRRYLLLALVVLGLGLSHAAPASAQDKTITVFAAASMKNALDDINAAFLKATGTKVVTSYAASSALARQIEQGAPADIFASADLDWMDYAAQKKSIKDDTRVNLLGNRLVLIAPKESKVDKVTIGQGFDLAEAGRRRPHRDGRRQFRAGRQIRQGALEKLGIWASVEKKFAMADNVRAALALVARGEAVLGIVYETDAKVEPSVKIVGTIPGGLAPGNRLSGRRDRRRRSRKRAPISPSCAPASPRRCSSNTASPSW